MKRLLTMIAALGLVACGITVAHANDLYNPDLDILGAPGANGQANPGPDGWQIVCTKSISGSFNDGADSEPWCNVQQPNGWGVFFKPFQGSTNGGPGFYDLLNVYFYQDSPSSAGTKCTLSGYAADEANFCGRLPAPPAGVVPSALFVVEFLDNSGNILSSNAYDLIVNGMPNGGPSSMALLTTPQYTAPVGTYTVRAGATMLNAYGTGGGQSFFVDAFDLESVAPPGSPVITNQPVAASVAPGGTATFNVAVSNPAGVTNAWLKNGVIVSDVPSHISGSATGTLTITGATPADIGKYQAVVSNGLGLSRSKVVALALTGVSLDPVVSINGPLGSYYEVDYTTSLTPPIAWTLLTTVKLTSSPQNVLDTTAGAANSRYYQAVYLH
jgi:hypothetical protein